MDLASSLASYVAQDRRLALATGVPLAEVGEGAVVFADISGFTTLTAGLSAAYGPRRGAGELSRSLGVVYEGLVAAVEQWQGSVISFAGDAILCWFAVGPWGDLSLRARHALACARQMQAFLEALPALEMEGSASVKVALKVAITAGPTRRFEVGDPQLQLIDLLTGQTVIRAAEAEKTASSGEILIDETVWSLVGLEAGSLAWTADALGNRLASVSSRSSLSALVAPAAPRTVPKPSQDQLRPWVLPAVWTREVAGVGRFLPEFRPTVALFLRFTGFDYDGAGIGSKLDVFIRSVQRALAARGGALLHVEIGDKGSYLYGAFGAPEVHADDARRAVLTAWELRQLAAEVADLEPVQIGLSRGTMRTGSYGSRGRGCYSALGDEVNVAARLMEWARPGEILVAGRVRVELGREFELESLGGLPMKGMPVAIPTFRLDNLNGSAARQVPSDDELPLVGRDAELEQLCQALTAAQQGSGGVRVLTGDAGIGKSRLADEVRRRATAQGLRVVVAQALSETGLEPWQVWVAVWEQLFGDGASLTEAADLETLDPRDRKSALEARAVDALRTRALSADLLQSGLLVILNDGHGMDAASLDLFFRLAGVLDDLPVLLLATSRPSPFSRTCRERFPHGVTELTALGGDDARSLVDARAQQMLKGSAPILSPDLAKRIVARAHGNPFFLDELVRYFHYRRDVKDLPDSVHALVLQRLDGVDVRGQSFLKCASVLGLRFAVADVGACFSELGETDSLLGPLAELGFLQRTEALGDAAEFRHPLTREAIYESIDSTTRAELHDRYALWLESQPLGPLTPSLEALAHHFTHGHNRAKSQVYLLAAGDAAARAYLNAAAMDHYRRLLDLVADRVPVLIKLASVLETVGEWSEARGLYQEALTLSREGEASWSCLYSLGRLSRRQGAMDEAAQLLARAKQGWSSGDNPRKVCECCVELATLNVSLGNYGEAEAEIRSAQATGVLPGLVSTTRGYSALAQGDFPAALLAFSESLVVSQRDENRRGIADAIDNLARVRHSLRDLDAASADYEKSLEMYRAMGDLQAVARTLNTCGMIAWSRGQSEVALGQFRESLRIAQVLGDKPGQAKYLNNIGTMHHVAAEFEQARDLYSQALDLCRELGERKTIGHILCNLGMVEGRLGRPEQARDHYDEAYSLGQTLGDLWTQGYSRLHGAMLDARSGRFAEAWAGLEESLATMRTLKNALYQVHAVAGMVCVAQLRGLATPACVQAAGSLIAWVESSLAAQKARLESEFQRPWDEALAAFTLRHQAAWSPLEGDWESWLEVLGKGVKT